MLLPSSRPLSRAPSPSDAPIVAEFVWETIVCDLHSSALQVAMLTIMLGASARPQGALALRSGRHMLHDDCKVMILALHYGEQAGLPPASIRRIDSFYRSVGDAKLKLRPLLQAVARTASPSELLHVAQSWRRLAVAACEALAEVDALIKSQLSSVFSEDAATLRRLLKEAADGDVSHVDATGSVRLPALRQRRSNPRTAVRRACRIVLPDGVYSAEIADVSRRGLGLVCAHRLDDGQDLRVALEDGRELEATVVRRQGDQIGLSLRAPLSTADPLFQPSRRG